MNNDPSLALFYHWLHVLTVNKQAPLVWYMYRVSNVTPNVVRSTKNQGHLTNPAVPVSWLTWGFPTDEAERTGTVLVVPGPSEILPTCLYLDTESTVIYVIRFTGKKVLKVSLQTHIRGQLIASFWFIVTQPNKVKPQYLQLWITK